MATRTTYSYFDPDIRSGESALSNGLPYGLGFFYKLALQKDGTSKFEYMDGEVNNGLYTYKITPDEAKERLNKAGFAIGDDGKSIAPTKDTVAQESYAGQVVNKYTLTGEPGKEYIKSKSASPRWGNAEGYVAIGDVATKLPGQQSTYLTNFVKNNPDSAAYTESVVSRMTVENLRKKRKSFFAQLAPFVSIGLSLFAPGIGTAIGAALGATGTAATVLGSAIVNGTLSEMSGGDFVDGAIKGAISAGVAPAVSSTIGSAVSEAMADSAFKNIVTNAVNSSATSALTAGFSGGDVGQAALAGALTGAGSAAGQELGISAKYGTDAFSEQTKALLSQEQGLGGASQVGGSLGVAAGKIAAGGDAEQILTSTLVNNLTQGVTDTLKSTVNNALKNPSAIVADSGNLDSNMEVPGAGGLESLLNGPRTQLASADNESAMRAIDNLRNKEDEGVTVIPGENGTKLVLDGDGNVVDMITATEPSVELKQVDPSRKEIPPLTDKPAQYIVGEPIQNPSEELRRVQDILTNAGSNLTVDANGFLKEISKPEVEAEPTNQADPEEKNKFQGPMGPFKEDTANRYKEEFAKYLDYLQSGSPPPPEYEPPPFNEPGPYWDEFNQNLKTMMDEGRLPSQWQGDEEGNYTYVADDGSTLTLGPNGDIVHHTEAPAGNLPGETPAPEPAKQPAAPGRNVDWSQLLKNAAGAGAIAIGAKAVGDLLTDDNEQVQPQVQAPRNKLKMDWNQADIQAPVNGIAYGQQYFNPVFTEVTAAEGGLMSLAGGGMLGSYSDGGRLLRGPGDGMSDNIPASISGRQPARLADGEFVIPADVVSHLGNGSTEAGSKVLYKMMERIRKARTGNPKQGKQINPSKFMPK